MRRARVLPRRGILAAALILCATALPAQDHDMRHARNQTLADIQAEIAALSSELGALKAHLNPTAGGGAQVAGASALQRLDSIEGELQRLTAKTEELEFRIRRIVKDGAQRIATLTRRVCALEPDCRIGPLRDPTPLGGDAVAPLPLARNPAGPELAVDESAALERGKTLLANGNYSAAAEVFTAHLATWPRGPLSTEAELLRGQSLEGAGDPAGAARAYLAAFSADKDGAEAPVALTGLGRALAALGQEREACAALSEVNARFPRTAASIAAAGARAQLSCE